MVQLNEFVQFGQKKIGEDKEGGTIEIYECGVLWVGRR